MIRLNLTEGYYIELEGVDHVLKQSYTTKPKKEGAEPKVAERNIGYFSNLEKAIERYLLLIQSKHGDGLSLNMNEYIELIREINAESVRMILESGEGIKCFSENQNV